MKHAKRFLVAQAILMYLTQLPLLVFAIIEMIPDMNAEGLVKGLFYTGIAGAVGMIFVSIAGAVISLVSVFKKPENPLKTSMIVKLALIPWYAINFFFCFCLFAGMLNPFLLLAIPVVMFIASCLTYINMAATSLPSLAYFISNSVRNKRKPCGWEIASLIFHFVFCMDAIGAIILYVLDKKKEQIE